jgi:hypothetical protein
VLDGRGTVSDAGATMFGKGATGPEAASSARSISRGAIACIATAAMPAPGKCGGRGAMGGLIAGDDDASDVVSVFARVSGTCDGIIAGVCCGFGVGGGGGPAPGGAGDRASAARSSGRMP